MKLLLFMLVGTISLSQQLPEQTSDLDSEITSETTNLELNDEATESQGDCKTITDHDSVPLDSPPKITFSNFLLTSNNQVQLEKVDISYKNFDLKVRHAQATAEDFAILTESEDLQQKSAKQDRGNLASTLSLNDITFGIKNHYAKGKARFLSLSTASDTSFLFEDIGLNLCPLSERYRWQLEAKKMVVYDSNLFILSRVNFKVVGVKLPAIPSIKLYLDGTGATGFLAPRFLVRETESGLDLSLPYHFRLAQNMDLTLVPRVIVDAKARGFEGVYRYLLSERSHGQVEALVMSSENFPTWRYARWTHLSQSSTFHLNLDLVDAINPSLLITNETSEIDIDLYSSYFDRNISAQLKVFDGLWFSFSANSFLEIAASPVNLRRVEGEFALDWHRSFGGFLWEGTLRAGAITDQNAATIERYITRQRWSYEWHRRFFGLRIWGTHYETTYASAEAFANADDLPMNPNMSTDAVTEDIFSSSNAAAQLWISLVQLEQSHGNFWSWETLVNLGFSPDHIGRQFGLREDSTPLRPDFDHFRAGNFDVATGYESVDTLDATGVGFRFQYYSEHRKTGEYTLITRDLGLLAKVDLKLPYFGLRGTWMNDDASAAKLHDYSLRLGTVDNSIEYAFQNSNVQPPFEEWEQERFIIRAKFSDGVRMRLESIRSSLHDFTIANRAVLELSNCCMEFAFELHSQSRTEYDIQGGRSRELDRGGSVRLRLKF